MITTKKATTILGSAAIVFAGLVGATTQASATTIGPLSTPFCASYVQGLDQGVVAILKEYPSAKTDAWRSQYAKLVKAQQQAITECAPYLDPPSSAKPSPYLATFKGNGQGNTATFTIPATSHQWQVAWSYNCTSFGSAGEFSVDVNGGQGNNLGNQDENDIGPDTQGMSGSGVDTFYDTGTFDFQVIANACNWNLRVIK